MLTRTCMNTHTFVHMLPHKPIMCTHACKHMLSHTWVLIYMCVQCVHTCVLLHFITCVRYACICTPYISCAYTHVPAHIKYGITPVYAHTYLSPYAHVLSCTCAHALTNIHTCCHAHTNLLVHSQLLISTLTDTHICPTRCLHSDSGIYTWEGSKSKQVLGEGQPIKVGGRWEMGLAFEVRKKIRVLPVAVREPGWLGTGAG